MFNLEILPGECFGGTQYEVTLQATDGSDNTADTAIRVSAYSVC